MRTPSKTLSKPAGKDNKLSGSRPLPIAPLPTLSSSSQNLEIPVPMATSPPTVSTTPQSPTASSTSTPSHSDLTPTFFPPDTRILLPSDPLHPPTIPTFQTLPHLPENHDSLGPTFQPLTLSQVQFTPLTSSSPQPPFTISVPHSPCPRGKEKRRSPSPPLYSKRRRILLEDNVNISMARMHIHSSPIPDTDSPPTIPIIADPIDTMITEDTIAIVRRRFIHVKRLALRPLSPQHNSTHLMELSDHPIVDSTLLKAEEAGHIMPPTFP